MAINPDPLLEIWIQSLSLRTQPLLFVAVVRVLATFLAGKCQKCHSARSLWWILFILPSEYSLFHCLLRFWNSPLTPPVRGFSSVWKHFFFHDSLFRAQVPAPKFFVSLFAFIFYPTSFWGDLFAFLEAWGPLLVFRNYSVCGSGGDGDLSIWFLHHLVSGSARDYWFKNIVEQLRRSRNRGKPLRKRKTFKSNHVYTSQKTLQSPLDCKETKTVNSKGNQSWIFIGRTDAEVETPILWPPDVKS